MESCPRCDSRLYPKYDLYLECLICGYIEELVTNPVMYLEDNEYAKPIDPNHPRRGTPLDHSPRREEFPLGIEGKLDYKKAYQNFYYWSRIKDKRKEAKP